MEKSVGSPVILDPTDPGRSLEDEGSSISVEATLGFSVGGDAGSLGPAVVPRSPVVVTEWSFGARLFSRDSSLDQMF